MFVRRSMCAIPFTFPTVGASWCKNNWPSLATYPYLSSRPLCQRTLPRADGQLCFLFISAADEDILAKGKQSIKSQPLGNQNSENEILLEGDDDTLSSVDEKDLENLTGKFNGWAAISASSRPISIYLLFQLWRPGLLSLYPQLY